MYLITCWKYKQSHIFISPCPNNPSQLQNCRTKRFFTVFGTSLVTWRQRKEILSPTHPHTPRQGMFCLFFASSNVSFGLIHETLHRFNGCAKIWSAPGIFVHFFSPHANYWTKLTRITHQSKLYTYVIDQRTIRKKNSIFLEENFQAPQTMPASTNKYRSKKSEGLGGKGNIISKEGSHRKYQRRRRNFPQRRPNYMPNSFFFSKKACDEPKKFRKKFRKKISKKFRKKFQKISEKNFEKKFWKKFPKKISKKNFSFFL